MKNFLIWLALAATSSVHAQEEFSGIWQGEMDVTPDIKMTVQFAIASSDSGSYSASILSPSNPTMKETEASSVSVTGSNITLEFGSLSGSYQGQLVNGVISGNWQQPGATLPLELTPWQKPVMSERQIAFLEGSWTGELDIMDSPLQLMVKFIKTDEGTLNGTLEFPEQGGSGIPLTDFMLADGKLNFSITPIKMTYSGSLEGEEFKGTWSQGGRDFPLNLKRGSVEIKTPALSLSDQAMAMLEGKWTGKLEMPSLSLVFRFERDEAGNSVAFVDSPDQGATGIPVSSASLDEQGHFSMELETIRASYSAELVGDKMVGNWSQGPGKISLTMTKKQDNPVSDAKE